MTTNNTAKNATSTKIVIVKKGSKKNAAAVPCSGVMY